MGAGRQRGVLEPGTTYYTSEYATGGLTGKGSLDDLSLRSPLIFSWKDRYTASFDEHHLISALDIYPTLLEIGGVALEEATEGVSLVPLLSGVGAAPDRDVMITYSDNRRTDHPMGGRAEGYALRTKRWHFYWYRDTRDMRLYDVTTDPRGESDLSQARPDLVAASKPSTSGGLGKRGLLATSRSTSEDSPWKGSRTLIGSWMLSASGVTRAFAVPWFDRFGL